MPIQKATAAPPQTTLSGTQSAASPEATGELKNLTVRGDAGTGRVSPDPRQVSGSSRETLGTPTSGTKGFVNRSSAAPERSQARRANFLVRIGRTIRELPRRLASFFAKGRNTAPGRTGGAAPATALNPAQMQHQVQSMLADAARRGVDAAKSNMQERILGEHHSTDQALALLSGGDSGIRRATTAAQNLQVQLNPHTLPPDTLNGTPQQWAEQTKTIKGLAAQVSAAQFSDKASGRFLDYGTSGDANPFGNVAKQHPQLDHPVRNWISQGVGLIDKMVSAQERAFNGQPPLSENEVTALKEQVNAFTSNQETPQTSDAAKGVGEGFADELIKEFDAKMETQSGKPEKS